MNWVVLTGGKVENVKGEICQECKNETISCKNFSSDGWIQG